MRKVLGVLLVILAWTLGLGAQGPPPERWVTDGPGILSPAVRTSLDQRLAAYERATGHQVLLWIGSSTGETPLEDWTVRTFAAWKVGRKGLDDGLVLFLFAQDRKLRIEVGYGLEGQMPDALASRIIREDITPRLASGDWDGAASAGVEQILKTLGVASQDTSQHPSTRAARSLSPGEIIVIAILGLGFLILLITHPGLAVWLLFSMLSGGRSGGGGRDDGWSGGGGSSGGGGASGSW